MNSILSYRRYGKGSSDVLNCGYNALCSAISAVNEANAASKI